MAVETDHAALEDGKEANWPRPYDDDVGLLRVSGGHGHKLAQVMRK
jgi:hypothetical protein